MPVVPLPKKQAPLAPAAPQVDPRFLDMAAALMRKEGKIPSSAEQPTVYPESGPRNILGAPRS